MYNFIFIVSILVLENGSVHLCVQDGSFTLKDRYSVLTNVPVNLLLLNLPFGFTVCCVVGKKSIECLKEVIYNFVSSIELFHVRRRHSSLLE